MIGVMEANDEVRKGKEGNEVRHVMVLFGIWEGFDCILGRSGARWIKAVVSSKSTNPSGIDGSVWR